MENLRDWLTLIVAITGVISSGLIAFLAYTLNKQAERAQTQRAISEAYKKVTDYRSQHPEVMHLSHLWKDECFEKIYAQPDDENTRWVFLTENYPLIARLLPQAKYISTYILDFYQVLEIEGWDWQKMHRELIGQGNLPPTPPFRDGS